VTTLMQPMADQSAQAVVSRSRHRKTLRRKINCKREFQQLKTRAIAPALFFID